MRMSGIYTVAAAASVLLGACSSDITVPNYNSPTTTGVSSDPNSIQLLANGVVYTLGSAATGYISATGILGRESYSYPPTEGRNVTNYLQADPLDPAGFAGTNGSVWSTRYNNLRNIFNLQTAVATTSLTAQQKSAASGFAKTMEGLELYYVIATHDTLGAPVQLTEELNFVAPFVSRDSVYRYISARLDEGAADLAAGGATFPFTVNMEFRAIGPAATSPTDFIKFNRAIAARVLAYRGSLGLACAPGSCYQQVLTALSGSTSFLDAAITTRAGLDAGAYTVYGTASGTVQNTLSQLTSGGANIFAHPSILRDTTGRDADGRSLYTVVNASRNADLRTQAKVRTLPTAATPPGAVGASALTTPYGFNNYPTASSPLPVIRKEELVLLRAEANIGLGNLDAALADINTIRTVSGGLAPLATLGSSANAIDALLYERRLSLLWEGHRINDLRRFGRLNTLPLDKVATATNNVRHYVQSVFPIPQAECLSRVLDPSLRPAGCP